MECQAFRADRFTLKKKVGFPEIALTGANALSHGTADVPNEVHIPAHPVEVVIKRINVYIG